MSVINQIFQAYDEGHSTFFLKGRSLYDLVVDSDGKIRPILETLRRDCLYQYGMVFISYCLARGLDWDASQITDKRDRNTVQQVLKSYHLKDIPQDHNEVIRVFRSISSLSRTPPDEFKWSNGSDMRFLFLFEFSEHIMPGSLANGTQTDQQLVATELVHLTTQSLALRSSGNLIIFHGRDGMVDELVSNDIYHIRMKQPDLKEKKEFLKLAPSIYNSASFEEGLSEDSVAHLTTNTPNRSLESHLRSSHIEVGRK